MLKAERPLRVPKLRSPKRAKARAADEAEPAAVDNTRQKAEAMKHEGAQPARGRLLGG